MLIEVIKRDGSKVPFSAFSIRRAILNANTEVSSEERATDKEIDKIIKYIKKIDDSCIHIETIQDIVEKKLMEFHHFDLAKRYITYRYIHNVARALNKTEKSVLDLIRGTNDLLMNENSNKDPYLNSTTRDLMAGEVSKSISDKFLIPEDIVKAHEEGILHWHDKDYSVQPMINCFSKDTYFVTNKGTFKFSDFKDGDIVVVPTHTGEYKKAIVRCYGKQQLYRVELKRGTYSNEVIECTRNHTWILKDGTRTTDLKVGDTLYQTPIIDKFDINSLSESDAKIWCLGFALGDGGDYDNNKYGQTGKGIRVRLCGKKNKYSSVFAKAGFSVTYPESLNGDASIYMINYSKQDFLDNELWLKLSDKERIILFNGYISADGEFGDRQYAKAVSTSDLRLKKMTLDLAEQSGYFVSTLSVRTGSTNFTEERKPLYTIGLNRSFYEKQLWKVKSIKELESDVVWCLEVEDNHSFILSGGIVTGNCMLINIGDMLENGTVMNNLLIESPHTFRVACNIMTQIIATVASNQYGGQSVNIKHLGKYLALSRERLRIRFQKSFQEAGIKYTEEQLNHVVEQSLKKELEDGVQTIQYQINCLLTTNGCFI